MVIGIFDFIGNRYTYTASLVKAVKNPPAMQETWETWV